MATRAEHVCDPSTCTVYDQMLGTTGMRVEVHLDKERVIQQRIFRNFQGHVIELQHAAQVWRHTRYYRVFGTTLRQYIQNTMQSKRR